MISYEVTVEVEEGLVEDYLEYMRNRQDRKSVV